MYHAIQMFLLLMLLFLTGCVSTLPHKMEDGQGGLLVSVVHKTDCDEDALSSSVMKITPKGYMHSQSLLASEDIGEYRFTVVSPLMKKTKEDRGYVQFLPMAPGEYWLSGIVGMGWNVKFNSSTPLKLAFDVEPGKVSYIGELEMALKQCGSARLNTHNFSHVPFEIRMDLEEDIRIFSSMNPDFNANSILKQELRYLKNEKMKYNR